jgi:hypothetical protein
MAGISVKSIPARRAAQSESERPAPEVPLFRILEALDRLDLTSGERRTLKRLLRRDIPIAKDGQRKGYVYAKLSSLASELGCSTRTVSRNISQLCKLKIISRDRKNLLRIYIHYQALRISVPLCYGSRYGLCPGCGEPLLPKRANQRYHSAACRMKAHRRMLRFALRNVTLSVTLCFGCGSQISQTRRDKRHCNAVCRVRAKRARERKYHAFRKNVTAKRNTTVTHCLASQADSLRRVDTSCPGGRTTLSTPTKIRFYKNNNNDVPLLYSLYVRRLHHPKLRELCRRHWQMERLFKSFNPDDVKRAISQADLQYGANNGIRNAYGLIYAMCRSGFDDTLLRERECETEQQRLKAERQHRLRELQARGCVRCGWWDVGFDGYCYECRSFKNAGISTKGGSDPPLMVFDSAALEVEAASRPGSSTGVPPATLIIHGGR